MRLLILGGTRFVGRHLVEAALAGGHEVTLFNRGRSAPGLFPQVEQLQGDRDGGLAVLKGRRWDAAIDVNGYIPRLVRDSAQLLAGQVEHYTFISTISVLADSQTPHQDESAPVATLSDPATEELTPANYGALKALCERAAAEAMPGRVLTIRPGLIVGPHDYTNRFAYWVERVAQGGEVLAPAPHDRPVQFIDVRDLAEWTLRMVADRQTGVYMATGPARRYTMGEFLGDCRRATGSDATFTWVPESFLLEQGVTPWSEIPLWVPKEGEGIVSVNVGKAVAAGLTFRPVTETVRDTRAWLAELDPDRERKEGLTPEREAQLLARWRQDRE